MVDAGGDPTTVADEVLLARPDSEALAELDRRYRGRVAGWVSRRHHDPQLVDEVATRTMTRLWEQRGRFDPDRGSAAAWVFMLARTVFADTLRERRRQPQPRPRADDLAVDDEADRIVSRAVVQELLNRLSQEHREVIGLAFIDGLTHTQIAQRLNLPLGTVKTRIFYGLRALRSAAEEIGVNLR